MVVVTLFHMSPSVLVGFPRRAVLVLFLDMLSPPVRVLMNLNHVIFVFVLSDLMFRSQFVSSAENEIVNVVSHHESVAACRHRLNLIEFQFGIN